LQILDGKLDTIVSDIGDVQTDVTSIKGTVEDSNTVLNSVSFGNAALKTLIDSVNSAVVSIQNTTRTVVTLLPQLPKPPTGTKTYRVDVLVYNMQGSLEDPDSNSITITLQNVNGNDRGNLIVGNASGPFVIPAGQREGVGKYYYEIEIATSTAEEALNMFADYTEGAVALRASRATEIVPDVQVSGFALETTAQSILTDTQDMKPRVQDVQTEINSAVYGLSALKVLIDAMDVLVTDSNTKINDGGYGLAAIAADLTGKASQVSVDNIANDLTNNVKGAGFDNATDSLKQISDRTFSGGQAI